MSELLIVWAAAISAVSGVPGLFMNRTSNAGQVLATALSVFGAILGLTGIGYFWAMGNSQPIRLPWAIEGAEFHVAIDGLSALFLLPIFLVSALGSIYGLGYWKQTAHPENGRKLRLCYGLLTAGMVIVVIARNGILFLFGWEAMALSAYFLVITEDHDPEVCATGWIYLVATHISTMFLIALIALLQSVSGSYTLEPLNDAVLAPAATTAIFVLILLGFGIKAGIMPFHVWLPGAHAMAPSHVSAMMSGVIIKMGIYGIVRFTSLVPNPPVEWGGVLLVLGAISGVLGVAFAIGQHDLKRLLAYHSIENIGIIVIGIGLALIGRSLGREEWIILGMSGALLHVWNHAMFKALLFLSAGSVIHAAHTREIDRLGGLAKQMPYTSFCFLVGAVAICGLPPLNGFISEYMIYLGLFSTLGIDGGTSSIATAFAAPTLALIGALALACFVKVYGAVFLGTARTQTTRSAHESGISLIGPMAVLVVCCLFIGLAPAQIAPVIARAVSACAPEIRDAGPRLESIASLNWIENMALTLVALFALTSLLFWIRLKNGIVESGPTWGCGFAAPNPRMQYTSSSFAEMLVGLFSWALRPNTHRPHNLVLFPQRTDFHSHVPDVALDTTISVFSVSAWLISWVRVLQQGDIHIYLLYVFLALFVLLLCR